LPVPGLASFGITQTFGITQPFGIGQPFDRRPQGRSRTALARHQIPLPPVPIWPRSLDDEAAAPPLAGNPALPAPSPQSFGYPRDAAAPAPAAGSGAHKAAFDVVPETTGNAIELRRILMENDRAKDDSVIITGSVPLRPPQREPVATTSMPRGAFP
jgi:hypothetical protein